MPQSVPRRAIANSQRAALRAWFRSEYPRPSYTAAIQWFENHYKHRLSKSTISESLGSKFDFLDLHAQPRDPEVPAEPEFPEESRNPRNPDLPAQAHKPKFLTKEKLRARSAQWPELEQVLYTWHQKLDAKGANLTGDLIREQARVLWRRLESTKHLPLPVLSNGWLEGFKARHGIYRILQHGEVGSVPAAAEEEMLSIIHAARRYPEEDIFNMDETGLFWRMVPSAGLSSQRRGGVKKDKARVSVALCSNANGTERLRPYVIGKALRPRAFTSINVEAMGIKWHANAKAWMTNGVMQVWLREFYTYVGQRRVLLLLDGLGAHHLGLQLCPPPDNIEVLFLPANATSKYQPMDQGIIQNFKVYYRKQWLQYMIQAWEEEKDPTKEVNLRLTVRWIVRAWQEDVSCQTIRNCYRKSTVLATPRDAVTPAVHIPDVSSLYRQAQEAGRITDAMSLINFLNPQDESYTDENPDPLEAAIEEVLGGVYEPQGPQGPQGTQEDEDENGPPPPPIPTLSEALEALERVTLYLESRADGSPSDLRILARLERRVMSSYVASLKQSSLDSWFISN